MQRATVFLTAVELLALIAGCHNHDRWTMQEQAMSDDPSVKTSGKYGSGSGGTIATTNLDNLADAGRVGQATITSGQVAPPAH